MKYFLQEGVMLTARDLRAKRAAAGISGEAVCRVIRFSRSKLSSIERENSDATPEELAQIEAAINKIVETREHVARLATEAGLSLVGVNL
jgi:transcriptional regulator with XRE-family HTH domain